MKSVNDLPVIKELPDPFQKGEGGRIASSEEWESQRVALQEMILHYQYGSLPPVPTEAFIGRMENRRLDSLNAVEQEILLMTGTEEAISFSLTLTIPDADAPVPAIICGDRGWGRIGAEIVTAVIRRGYALAEFHREEVAPDGPEQRGVYAAYLDYDGGRLAAWAWGFHRVCDYLLTRPEIDPQRIAVTGHSRGGKAALLAGATDTRIALTAPNNSGCGGAGCYRFMGAQSEDAGAIVSRFPYWFHPRFAEFIAQIERLPFDQHTLKALVAPRALLSTEALGDLWANPSGTQITHLAAKEVYTFLGAENRIGICFREGGHAHNLQDWSALLDFAEWQFRGEVVARRFDRLAFPADRSGFSWSAPGLE
jgi:hypothetical protein